MAHGVQPAAHPHHVAYRHARQSVTELLRGHPEALDRRVPACPEWAVRDLLTHLVDICASVHDRAVGGTGGSAGADGGGATEAAMALARWDRLATEVEARAEAGGLQLSDPLIMDVLTHELDLRHTLGEPFPGHHPAFAISLDLVVRGFARATRERDLPTLQVEPDGEPGGARWRTDGGDPSAPAAEPAATLRGHPYDLLRSFTGRRTHRQIARLAWSQDPAAWLPAFTWGPFTPPAEPTEELLARA